MNVSTLHVYNLACQESLGRRINALMCTIYTAGNYEPPFSLGELLLMDIQSMDTGWMEWMEKLWFCLDKIYNQNSH